MALAYEEMFLLRLFSDKKAKKETSVYYILQGKRTASMLYRAVDYELESVFGFFPKLDRAEYQKQLVRLIAEKYLILAEESQAILLTTEGQLALKAYFAEHYEPHYLNWLTEGKTVSDFQKVTYFLTQIFSEACHDNHRYIPIEKNTAIQQWVKKWLYNQSSSSFELGVLFGLEWKKVLSQLEPKNAVILVQLMTGHNMTGWTKAQIAQRMQLEETEVRVRLLDALNGVIQSTEENETETPLFSSILSELRKKNQMGISKSAQDTFVLLKQSYSVDQICTLRKLKKSTISEHIIELVIVDPSLESKTFVPAETYFSLQQLFEAYPDVTYQEAAAKIPHMEFYWFRLVEIERSRKNASSS